MISNFLKYALVISIIGFLSACSFHQSMHDKVHNKIFHDEFMRGPIVRVEDRQVVLCIGSRDGVEAGMVFNVFQVNYEGAVVEGTDNYSLQPVGEIEIHSVIDEHFARGYILHGDVESNNVVELSDD